MSYWNRAFWTTAAFIFVQCQYWFSIGIKHSGRRPAFRSLSVLVLYWNRALWTTAGISLVVSIGLVLDLVLESNILVNDRLFVHYLPGQLA